MSARPPVDMRGALAWAASNSVAGNLLALMLIVGGLLLGPRVKKEVFPEFTLDIVQVAVVYPGASPEEVEQGVIIAIEEAVRGLDGVKEITSVANEGLGSIRIEFEVGTNRTSALSDVESAVGRVTSLPVDAERPTIAPLQTRNENLQIVVYGDVSEDEVRRVASDLREELLQDPGITLVELDSVRPLEISISVSSENLRRYGLTLDGISRQIADSSIDLPGGSLRTGSGEILVRTRERRDWASEFGDVVLRQTPEGDLLQLRNIATIEDTFRETDELALFNSKRAAMLRVYRVGNQSPVEVTEAARAFMQRAEPTLPDGISLALVNDRSELYRGRVDLLVRNAVMGLILVMITLGLFLELKLAFWVTFGIPVSFLGALMLMPATGVSINMISLFAFILVLGIVVDDAIVVGDAIYERRKQGYSGLEAAVLGVREVAKPIVFAIATTVVAFLPLLFVPGFSGKLIQMVPTVVILVLLISLFEGLFVLPAHLAHSKPGFRGGFLGLLSRGQEAFARGFDWFSLHIFRAIVRPALKLRYATIGLALASLVVAVGLVAGGLLRFTFLPRTEGDVVMATVVLPYGTPATETEAVVRTMASEVEQLLEQNGGFDQVAIGVYAEVGSGGMGSGASGSHVGMVTAFLVPIDQRPFSASELAEMWRAEVGDVPGVEQLSFVFNIGPSGGNAVSIELSHPDSAVLEAAAAALGERVAAIEGTREVDDGVNLGKVQLDFTLLPAARSIGITPGDMARQIRSAFYGAEVLRQQRGRDEVRVFVRLPESERNSEDAISAFMLRTPTGGEIPLAMAAEIEEGRAYTSITREDGRRIVTVTADVDQTVTTGNDVNATIRETVLPEILREFPRLSARFGGEQEEQGETIAALRNGMALAILAMFALMAIGLKSYFQPLVILTAIPFGFAGAIFGHRLLGYDLSLMSMFGMVALAGVAVNDSIVLVDAINTFRARGMSIFDACLEASVRRLRPIILTSMTTFFGLAPMLAETSAQARFLIPMAISLAFGVLYTTIVTLLVVPSLYVAAFDGLSLLEKLGRRLGFATTNHNVHDGAHWVEEEEARDAAAATSARSAGVEPNA